LDALLPKVEKGVVQLPLESIRPSRFQPRRRLDPEAITELAASIAAQGVLQPLLVRPVDGGYEIVAGERRFRAAEQAGLTSVPVIVKELSDQATLELAIVENVQREALTPVEEARAYQQLLGFGLSQEAVAKAVGKSRSAVANTLRLLNLPPEGLEALERGEISAGHARAILAQPAKDQLWALQEIIRKGLSVRAAERLKRVERTAARQQPAHYRELEQTLMRQLGTRVRITGVRKGKLELHYYSADDLERLLALLGYQG
jgi:ParB family chromosome partitioning protein